MGGEEILIFQAGGGLLDFWIGEFAASKHMASDNRGDIFVTE